MMIAQLAGERCKDLWVDENIKINLKNDEKMETYVEGKAEKDDCSTCRREMQGSKSL